MRNFRFLGIVFVLLLLCNMARAQLGNRIGNAVERAAERAMTRQAERRTENADLKFSVEGHTDNTGSAATNQSMIEACSQAVVDKLIENSFAHDRLTAAGKGQNAPFAANNTDEGHAKNRRVEFVKI